MHLHFINLTIIGTYLLLTLLIDVFISKRALKNIYSSFFSGNKIPRYILGVSNTSGKFENLINNKSLNIQPLLTHELKPEDAAKGYKGLKNHQDKFLGVIFNWTK